MNQPCRIELLGGLRVRQAEQLITRFRTRKAGVLLAYLAYHRRQTHPREVLVDLLWPERDLDAGRDNLSTVLSYLRHQLEPPGVPTGAILIADRFSLRLNPTAVTTDVADLETHLCAAEEARSEREREQQLADALALYTGPLLPGYYEEWIEAERNRLTEIYLQAVRRLVRVLVKAGDLPRALDYARQAVAADALREEAHRDLMRLYVATGQPSAALQQYRELERVLAQELGETPSAAIRQLAREIQARTENAGTTTRPSAAPTLPVEPSAPRADEPPAARTPESAEERTLLPPSGTVTFLLTDIEGSTALWERTGEGFREALAQHHALLNSACQRHGGYVFKEAGDGFLVAFQSGQDALVGAICGQQALRSAEWPQEVGMPRVRMALHTGDAAPQNGDYHGPALNRAARMLTAGHGGQILCSEATESLLRRDLEPDLRLKDLGVYRLRDLPHPEHLFQVEYPEMPERTFPALNAPPGYSGTLPMQFTRFFGRESELTRLETLLTLPETRLVTLTGPGGSGKTRLALEAARRLLETFSGAVWFVALADIADARRIPDAFVEALHLSREDRSAPMEQVVKALESHPSLLVLDNFEQLVEEGACLVRMLLEQIPLLTCLVTSRQRLELTGELELPISPLPAPPSGGTPEQVRLYESVQLFVDRAQAVKPDFQVTASNADAIARLCVGLEGLPLALELAAARAQVLTPAQMLAHLERRFDFLVSRRRDATERHKTLRAAIDWSYRLLPPHLQRCFTQLSVFRGGWSLEAAEAVCEEPLALDYLTQLRECSLIVAEDEGPQMRFRMLEMLREYAGQRLHEWEEVATIRARHSATFLTLAEQAKAQLSGPERSLALARVARDQDNLRTALSWYQAREDGIEEGLRLATLLTPFWHTHGHWQEGRDWLEGLLSRAGALECTEVRAVALGRAGFMAFYQGDYEAARMHFEAALAVCRHLGNRPRIIQALSDLGLAQSYQGDHAGARATYEESVALSRELEDPHSLALSLGNFATAARRGGDCALARVLHKESLVLRREFGTQEQIALALNNLGMVALDQKDFAGALAHLEESLEIRRELGDPWRIAIVLDSLGHLAQNQGDYPLACARFGESLALYRELGEKSNIALTLTSLAGAVRAQDDYDHARALLVESLTLRNELGSKPGIAASLESLASLAVMEGQYRRAARLIGAAEALRASSGSSLDPEERAEYECMLATAQAALDEATFAAARTVGKAMPLAEAIEFALQDG
jgi:predicted ATPase/DNA-binding SARP family transcriptional activator